MNSTHVDAYVCETCKQAYLDKRRADRCCEPRFCEDCGTPIPTDHYYLVCEPCREKRKFERARKMTLEEYIAISKKDKKDPLFYDEHFDIYEEDVESILDHYQDEDENFPKYVLGVKIIPFELDIDSALELAQEEMADEFEPEHHLVDLPELRNFVDQWNAKQTAFSMVDNGVIVFLPEELLAQREATKD